MKHNNKIIEKVLKETLLHWYKDIIPHANPENELNQYLSKQDKGITQVLLEKAISLTLKLRDKSELKFLGMIENKLQSGWLGTEAERTPLIRKIEDRIKELEKEK